MGEIVDRLRGAGRRPGAIVGVLHIVLGYPVGRVFGRFGRRRLVSSPCSAASFKGSVAFSAGRSPPQAERARRAIRAGAWFIRKDRSGAHRVAPAILMAASRSEENTS